MLIKRVLKQFCTQFEKGIKEARRSTPIEKGETQEESEEREQDYTLKRIPFYRFPIGLSKNFYYLAAPLIFMDILQMQQPYFSYQLTNAFCQLNDIYIFGFAGVVGAICACHFASKQNTKYMGFYAGGELVMLLGTSMYLFNMSPLLFGTYFVGTLLHLAWYDRTKKAKGVPKTYSSLYQKSILLTSLWIFVSAGAIVLLNQESKSIEMKIDELQKLSDSMNK